MTRPSRSRTAACLAVVACFGCAAAFAKLPPPSDEAKAKAAEAAAKAAWGDKIAAYQLCKSQDRVAANVQAHAREAGKEVKPPAVLPACADPGPYVAAPAASAVKPLEAAGAHSPTATAVAPPSGKATTAEIQGQPKK